jgi:hypothetical protein
LEYSIGITGNNTMTKEESEKINCGNCSSWKPTDKIKPSERVPEGWGRCHRDNLMTTEKTTCDNWSYSTVNKNKYANIDKSEAADAKRMRWILNGRGYFMEEEYLCGHSPCEQEQDEARAKIDEQIRMEEIKEAISME